MKTWSRRASSASTSSTTIRSFDGNDPAANAADDAAIATDKTALLPGQTATFANYTSYSRGINGIMVDIAGLPGNVTANDFVVHGRQQQRPFDVDAVDRGPDGDGSLGSGGAGIGAGRIDLAQQHDSERVAASHGAGRRRHGAFGQRRLLLRQCHRRDRQFDDRRPGDPGGHERHGKSNEGHGGHHQRSTISIATALVNAQDVSIVRSQHDHGSHCAESDHARRRPTRRDAVRDRAARLHGGPGRILVLFCAGDRRNQRRHADQRGRGAEYARTTRTWQGIAETTSTDGGQTWSPLTDHRHAPDFPNNYLGMGSMVVDQKTGTVFLLSGRTPVDTTDDRCYLMSTTDDGQDLVDARGYHVERHEPELAVYFAPARQRHSAHHRARRGATGRGLRLSLCGQHHERCTTPRYDGVIYSDDDGATWQFGGGPDPHQSGRTPAYIEAAIVQLAGGAIYMNSRLKYADNTAAPGAIPTATTAASPGRTCNTTTRCPCRSVEGSLIAPRSEHAAVRRAGRPRHYTRRRSGRHRYQMTIWASFDDGQTWTQEQIVNYDYASYSGMVALGHDSAMLVFVAGQTPTGIDGNDTYEKVELRQIQSRRRW